ncbi:ABC transporter substrate-binding protein [Amycolatopsis acidicola]|uniref:ABC transporter substrate-binding protein n=1 Tax=Amycolatopsis acidicola TaxID=2596893 RepID=UPI001FB74E93|nr:nitrate ABC transporter substrate-binding protein [Amycolatopsis acidicola]
MAGAVRPNEVVIAPNLPLFDLPEIVAIDRGLFERAGLSVRFAEGDSARARVGTERDPLARLKESLYESESADVYNLCEWGGIDRLERNRRGGRIAYLRPAVVAQALVTFDPELNEPHDLAGIPVGVNEFTGSHYTALHLLEGTLPRPEIELEHIGSPAVRIARARSGEARAVMLMEPWISLARKQGAHIIGSYFYRGSEVIAPNLDDERRAMFIRVVNEAVELINADPAAFRSHIVADTEGALAEDELSPDYYRYTAVSPFSEKRFAESYSWMKSWRLTDGRNSYENLLATR